nr:MAG TPA: SUN domain-containing protein 2, Nesprin-1-sandwich, LINC complex, STRUCTURAL PROTEIN [Caudoviricetes sp.]
MFLHLVDEPFSCHLTRNLAADCPIISYFTSFG